MRWRPPPGILVLLGAATGLRFAGLSASAIWYDEAFVARLVRLDLPGLVRAGAADFNPILNELIVWVSVRLVGDGEIGLRLPALLASVAALWLAYQMIEIDGSHSQALQIVALAGVALAPYQLWMAQDARQYALMSALYLGAARCAKCNAWAGLAACIGLLCYTHNVGPFYAVSAAMYALLRRPGQWRHVAAAAGAGLLSFAPWLPAYLSSSTGSFWLGPLTPTMLLLALNRIWFADTLSLPFAVMAAITIASSLALAVGVSVWQAGRARDTRSLALPALALGPLVIMLAISLTWKNLIFYRPLSALAIPMTLLIATRLARLPVVNLFAVWLWGVLVMVSLLAWQPQSKAGALRALAQYIDRQWRPGDVVYHATATSLLPFVEYSDRPAYLLDEQQPDGLLRRSLQDTFGLQRAALEQLPHDRAWLVWARDPELTDQADARMQHYIAGGVLIGEVHAWQFSTIQVWLVDP